MPYEIERKFLVTNNSWQSLATDFDFLEQGYLFVNAQKTLRVRIINHKKAFLGFKAAIDAGLVRHEFEYEIPVEEAKTLLNKYSEFPPIIKKRFKFLYAQFIWEIDVFEGANTGLIVAEVELPTPETKIELPNWVGLEITTDAKYFNAALSVKPYNTW
ncbi:MAG: CYTH domain-containing protein [Chitinophagales bacterium]|jgi:adenylate cyclase|nr:CYTH domain-containing protein [Sphingobacteriales bacterium]MBP9140783.1 CYTH domain-containing protein [Chitinophagales bacterium]MDA0199434.1 CYTH domain-containing protein [Bacteroidota bacterium]MBK6889751.1 CYTH domain-containing protein [Sphingobacteriales bacterium]MBK8678721.1 CYTH domain-containing protein [Sphingobacteriales bacterium]